MLCLVCVLVSAKPLAKACIHALAGAAAMSRRRARTHSHARLIAHQATLCRVLHGQLLGCADLAAAAALLPPCLKQVTRKGVDEGLRSAGTSMNRSQVAAIHAAARRTLTLWQGPPGTGKTRTIVSYVCALRKATSHAGVRIVVCAGSNVAVDNLVEGFLGAGAAVVRVGQPAKVHQALRAATLDAQVLRHRDGAPL